MAEYLDWPGARQVCRIERRRTVDGEDSFEVAYAITSLTSERADAPELLDISRNHWRIENKLHWVRDQTLGEDACRVTSGSAPQVLAALRNLILSLFGQAKVKNHAAALRSYANHPEKSFRTLGITDLP